MICKRGFFPAINSAGANIPKQFFGHPEVSNGLIISMDLGTHKLSGNPYHMRVYSASSTSNTTSAYYSGFSLKQSSSKLYLDKTNQNLVWGIKRDYDYTYFPKMYSTYIYSADNVSDPPYSIKTLVSNALSAVKSQFIGKYLYRIVNNKFTQVKWGVSSAKLAMIIDDKLMTLIDVVLSSSDNSITNLSSPYSPELYSFDQISSSDPFELAYQTSHNIKIGYYSYTSDTIKDYSEGYSDIPSDWKEIASI